MLVDMRNENKWSKAYDIIMLIAIFIGIFPLMFRSTNTLFWIFDLVSGICYIIDYIMRWSTADYKSKRKPWAAFLLYPFTPMAIIDLLSILPIVNLLSPTFKLARVSRSRALHGFHVSRVLYLHYGIDYVQCRRAD